VYSTSRDGVIGLETIFICFGEAMSSVGFGPSKKGRIADCSMMTRNVRIVAQGQADASYVENPKKNPFRLSSAILGGSQYGSAIIAEQNNGVSAPPTPDSGPQTFPSTYNLFSPFRVAEWLLNNDYSSESTDPVGITMMTASPFFPNPGSPRSSSFYTKYLLDLTKSFTLTATFLTKTDGNPPLDGFAVAISADPRRFGGNGGGLGIFGFSAGYPATTYPVLAVKVNPYGTPPTTSLTTANTFGTGPSGTAVPISSIATRITNINNLTVTVTLVYDSTAKTLVWTINDGTNNAASIYTNVELPALLGVDNGYVGVGAGAGAAIQPVFLTGMTYAQSTPIGTLRFGGTSYMRIGNEGDRLQLGTGDFTIEWWMNITPDLPPQFPRVFAFNDLTTNGAAIYGVSIEAPDLTKPRERRFYLWNDRSGGFNNKSFAFPESLFDTWHHFAIVGEAGNKITVYIDGETNASQTFTATSYNMSATNTCYLNIASFPQGGVDQVPVLFKGSITNFRIVKGRAVYTAPFTRPNSPLTVTPETTLLFLFDDPNNTRKESVSGNFTGVAFVGGRPPPNNTGPSWSLQDVF
jgi:Concanavalin A-like lectin/glucanases superfamily